MRWQPGFPEPLPDAPHGHTWRALGERSPDELRDEAAKYRAMAATASTAVVADGLRRIAECLEALAERREHEEGGDR